MTLSVCVSSHPFRCHLLFILVSTSNPNADIVCLHPHKMHKMSEAQNKIHVIYWHFYINIYFFSFMMRNVKVCIIKSTFFSFFEIASVAMLYLNRAKWAGMQPMLLLVGAATSKPNNSNNNSTKSSSNEKKVHNSHYQRRFIHHTMHMLTIWFLSCCLCIN